MTRRMYVVVLSVTRENVMNVWAEDVADAKAQAVEIAEKWCGVILVEVDNVEEV